MIRQATESESRAAASRLLPDYVFDNFRVYPGVRSDLMERLPSGLGRVLDIGCGAGHLGAALVAAGKATSVCGIDISPQAVSLAKTRLEEAYAVDLDKDEAPFPLRSFDTLLYADVLEHLKFPWAIVRAHWPLLREGGRAFCSIPNVGHYQVLLSLLQQRWEYRSEGILDYTHLRFFTRSSLAAMFRTAGYRGIMVRPLYSPSIKARIFELLTIRRLRDMTVRSWWLEASSLDEGRVSS